MSTIYHKLIQTEGSLLSLDRAVEIIGIQLLHRINEINSAFWYDQFTPESLFDIQGNKQAQGYIKTSNAIYILACINPSLVSEIKFPKFVCVISEDGFVIPTQKKFPEVTLEDILQKTPSYLTAATKAEQEAIAQQVNASIVPE